MSFRIGDKVVCVDDSAPKNPQHAHIHPAKKGVVYVVADAYIGWDGDLYVWMIGFPPAGRNHNGHVSYYHNSRFRLVSEVGHPPIQLARDCGVDNGVSLG